MRKIIIVVFILFISSAIIPQELSRNELDSLYNMFTFVRGVNTSDEIQKQFEEYTEITKCGLGLVTSIKQNLNNFSIEQQNVLFKILDRPIDLPNTAVSSNEFFRVHYTSTGSNAIGYDINLLLSALDSAYNFEINYLGYPAPPSDGSLGGDNKYDIYIKNLGRVYGQTTWENNVGSTNWTSFIEIDNDFPWYSSSNPPMQPINAARVTVAHEFYHAIQMGNYAPETGADAIRFSDGFFYEVSSTAMEEFVFSSVDDYYFYIPHYFNNPSKPFTTNPYTTGNLDGYDLAIWNIYLQKNFGFDILKNQWERIPTTPAIKAIALSFVNDSTNLGNELNKFGIWCYFTNTRAIEGRYFEEASNYPLITPTANVVFSPFSQTYNMSVNPTANYFLKINLPSPDGEFNSIVTNSDWQKAIDNPNQFLDFSFSVYHDTITGEKKIDKNYSISFSRDNQTFWNNAGILNNTVIYGDSSYLIPDLQGETFAYPMPIRKSTASKLYIAFQSNGNVGEEVDLNIYSAGAELYYSGTKSIQSAYLKNSNKYCKVSLNKSDFDFPSGVYIYVVKYGEDIFKGKLVIFND